MNRSDRRQLLLAVDAPMSMEKFLQLHSDGRELVFAAYNEVPTLAATADILEDMKDSAYAERNRLLVGFCALAIAMGFNACLMDHEGADWDDDWRTIVCIELPTGQVTWHIHDSEVPLFQFLSRTENHWDGHDTQEKYQRVLRLRDWLQTRTS